MASGAKGVGGGWGGVYLGLQLSRHLAVLGDVEVDVGDVAHHAGLDVLGAVCILLHETKCRSDRQDGGGAGGRRGSRDSGGGGGGGICL